MKTPMQELIEIIKKRQEDDEAMPFMYNDRIIELAESLLEKEKEVMCGFADRYVEEVEEPSAMGWVDFKISVKQYYDETFKTKEE